LVYPHAKKPGWQRYALPQQFYCIFSSRQRPGSGRGSSEESRGFAWRKSIKYGIIKSRLSLLLFMP
jgi:hypothetical protein